MKIACVDKNAADRIRLQKLFDDSFEECRGAVGHIKLAQTYPASKEEVLINNPPDLFAIGPIFPTEEAYNLCRELKNTFPSTPIVIFLQTECYSLRALKRFERCTDEIFSVDESPIRVVHKVSSFEQERQQSKGGKLIVVHGVKGGVGATSIVSGLVHAAQALEQNSIAIDLSPNNALIQYMGTERWQSPDLTSLIVDQLTPDQAAVERCITIAPNGVHVLLPPSGGTDVREMWLRDPKRFEITLSIIEVLKSIYDVVIVDVARIEGILNFALATRAHARLLVTSNDPASVHLLNSTLSSMTEMPGSGHIHILINQQHERSLTKDDVLDFLFVNEDFEEQMAILEPLPFDAHGKNWIGTGNTFFTESSPSVQQLLEDTYRTLMMDEVELADKQIDHVGLFGGLRKLATRVVQRERKVETTSGVLPLPAKALQAPPPKPAPAAEDNKVIFAAFDEGNGRNGGDKQHLLQPAIAQSNGEQQREFNNESFDDSASAETESSVLYEPPKLVANDQEE